MKDSLRNEDDNAGNNGGDAATGKAGKADEKAGDNKNDQGGDGEDGLACLIDPNTGKKMTKKRMQ